MSASVLTTLTKDACRDLVAKHFPHEMEMFESLWTSCFKALGATAVDELTEQVVLHLHRDPIRVLGAVGGGGAWELETLAAIVPLSTTAALMYRAMENPASPTISIEMLLANEATRLNVPAYVRTILLTDGVQMLSKIQTAIALANRKQQKGSDGHKHERSPEQPDQIYILAKFDGDQEPRGRTGQFEEPSQWQWDNWEVWVNEISGELCLFGKRRAIRSVPIRERLMLWLALSKMGKIIELEELQVLVQTVRGRREQISTSALYKHRDALGNLVGASQLDRFISKQGEGAFKAEGTFTFCWVRQLEDETSSKLLYVPENSDRKL